MHPNSTIDTVTVVLVTFQSEQVIGSSVSLVDQDPAVKRIIVVDNASRDGSIQAAREASPRVEVMANTENLGFGRGMNVGLEQADTEFSLVLNPDARFPAGGISQLVRVAHEYPPAAIVGPWWRNSAGRLTSVRSGPIWEQQEIPYLPDCHRSINFLPGAAMLLRNEVFHKIGRYFDPNLFMFGEDDELCQQALDAGHELIVTTSVEVDHESGTSSGCNPRIERLRNRHFAWSRLYVEEKYRGRDSALRLADNWKRQGWGKCLFYSLTGNRTRLDKQRAHLRGVSDYLAGEQPPVDLKYYDVPQHLAPAQPQRQVA